MAPSHVSGMKMRNLLFGVILGLFSVVHSTPVNTVTQDDIYKEALTDGYLIDNLFRTLPTTESPKRNATTEASLKPSSGSEDSDMSEGSALGETNDKSTTSVFLQHGDEHFATTTLSVSHAQSSTSTVLPVDTDDTSSDSSTTQNPQSGFSSTSMPNEALSEESNMFEGSALGDTSDESTTSVFLQHGDEHFATTTLSVSHAQSSTSTVLPMDTDDTNSDSSTTQIPQSGFSYTSMPNEALSEKSDMFEGSALGDTNDESTTSMFPQHGDEHFATTTPSVSHDQGFTSALLPRNTEAKPSDSPDLISVSQTTDPSVSITDSWSPDGLEEEEMSHQYPVTSSSMSSISNTETSTTSATSTSALTEMAVQGNEAIEGSGFESVRQSRFGVLHSSEKLETEILQPKPAQELQKIETVQPALPQNAGQGTPGWIIIVGFIVGVAALVMICVAIATRDKWNGPSGASQLESKTNVTNQQRELEMETFLHKDNPRENGKAAEYTVIPLDELPEKYPSH